LDLWDRYERTDPEREEDAVGPTHHGPGRDPARFKAKMAEVQHTQQQKT
jgi:hypothetical protein